MANLLLAVIYIAFISLGLPDAVLGVRMADDEPATCMRRFPGPVASP